MQSRQLALTLALSLGLFTTAGMAEENASNEAQANNPLANFKAFNIQNYYISSLSELDDQNANNFWLRYAQPFGKWLFRGSLPISRVPTGQGTTTSGLGDVSAFMAYLVDTGNPARSFGIGPRFTILDRGPGQPELQVYMALNMQFK